MKRAKQMRWPALLGLALMAGCQGGLKMKQKQRAISTQAVDTIAWMAPANPIFPTIFETAFTKGSQGKIGEAQVSFYGVQVGQLPLPTGRLIACDPLHIDEYGIAFRQTFPQGTFPVQVAVAKLKDEEYIAFSRILFSNEPVARWEYALLPDNPPLPMDQEAGYGFGVDYSMAVYMDSTANDQLVGDSLEGWNRMIGREMEKSYRPYWRYALINYGKHRAATFTTGYQDGRYASYAGYDAAGKICRLVTDYQLVEWRKK